MSGPGPDDGIHRVAVTRYGALLYDPADSPVGVSLDAYGEWAEAELEILGQILRPGDTAVDAGANIGTHSLFFSRAVGPAGTVYAFEPDPRAFALLEANIARNNTVNVRAQRAALGAGGETLDALGLQSCRLLKLDVDGGELDILRGAESLLAAAKPVVLVESNDPTHSRELIALFLRHSYTPFWHLAFPFRKGNARGRPDDIFQGAFDVNILAFPPSIRPNAKNFTPVTGPEDTWQAALERSKRDT